MPKTLLHRVGRTRTGVIGNRLRKTTETGLSISVASFRNFRDVATCCLLAEGVLTHTSLLSVDCSVLLFGEFRGRTIPNFFNGHRTNWPELSAGLKFSWGER